MKFRFFIFLFFALLVCRESFANAQVQKLINPFEASGQKIRLELNSSKTISSDLAILIDESCLLKSGHKNKYYLPVSISPAAMSGRRSTVMTHKVDFTFATPFMMDLLNRDPCILGVSPNQVAFADQVTNDPFISRQRHLDIIEYGSSLDFFSSIPTSNSVVVAVIDTGIELNHEDLYGNLWVNELELSGKPGVDDDGNGYIDDIHGYNFVNQTGDPSHLTPNDHGTHVAGLVAAVAGNQLGGVGVAGYRAKIMALNVFGSNWGTETVFIDRAIRYAADNGANVINISINGGGRSDTTAAAIVYAIGRGVTVVVSVGNKNEDISQAFTFPASYADIYTGLVSVGAVDAGTKQRCDFSNYGPTQVKISAPGCDLSSPQKGIYSTRKGNAYGYKAGTSMSAPIIAGAAALVVVGEKERLGSIPSPMEVESFLLRGTESSLVLEPFFAGGRVLSLSKLIEELKFVR